MTWAEHMRKIGDLDHPKRAERFIDYLYAQGIDAEGRRDGTSTDLWVKDDAQVPEAKAALQAFLAAPDDPRFDLTESAQRRRKAQHAAEQAWRRRTNAARRSVHGADGRGYITLGVIAVSLGVAGLGQLGSNLAAIQWMFYSLQPPLLGPIEILGGEVWRLITPIFVHFGLMHLLFNIYMWWFFGSMIEARKGAAWLLVFVLVTAAVSNTGEHGWAYLTHPTRLSLFGGLSGVLYAAFGYALVKGRIDPLDQIGVSQMNTVILLGWLILCMTGAVGNVANAAHVTGLIAGAGLALADIAWFRWRKR